MFECDKSSIIGVLLYPEQTGKSSAIMGVDAGYRQRLKRGPDPRLI